MAESTHLVQLLLPIRPGSRELFAETRQELVTQFQGVTAYVRTPAAGTWVNPHGEAEDDDVVMVEVLVDTFDSEWWRLYAELLAQRFEQQEIHVRAIPATVPARL